MDAPVVFPIIARIVRGTRLDRFSGCYLDTYPAAVWFRSGLEMPGAHLRWTGRWRLPDAGKLLAR